MTQAERLDHLIYALIREQVQYKDISIPADTTEKKMLLRALFNVRPPLPADSAFLKIQDEYLQNEISNKGITDIADLSPIYKNIYLWRGDITTLKVDAIVNAANDQLLGCFAPGHGCIDNAIHTYAGIQLRLACSDVMKNQNQPEETGTAKITAAYNLPSKYVLHTVGPIITGELTQKNCNLLASCYGSCLQLAAQNQLSSLAFCCISTGEFHFPRKRAAEIALQTIHPWVAKTQSKMKIVCNVFQERDEEIYEQLLRTNR